LKCRKFKFSVTEICPQSQELHNRFNDLNQRLEAEDTAEFEHKPAKAKSAYRVVVLRKMITEERGQLTLGTYLVDEGVVRTPAPNSTAKTAKVVKDEIETAHQTTDRQHELSGVRQSPHSDPSADPPSRTRARLPTAWLAP